MTDVIAANTSGGYERIGLIAGGGQFPLLFAHAAGQAGVEVIAVGFDGETDPMLAKYVTEFHMLRLGQLGRLIGAFTNAGIRHAAMAGTINKTRLYARIRPDWRAIKFLNRLRNNKDDLLLRALADELESEGISIEPSTLFLPGLLAPEGVLTRRKPNRLERSDAEFGWKMAKTVGQLDIGQCLVVRNKAVLAVEGIDGTDATIIRGGRLCSKGAVVIKVSKPIQDLRFDVPAVGFDTIATMKRVSARLLVIEAGKTLMFDREKMIDAADSAGIIIWARRDEATSEEEDYLPGGMFSSVPITVPANSVPEPQPRVAAPVLIRPPRLDALRVGVVGVGYLGRFHAQKYARLPEARLIGVADVNEKQASAVAAEVATSSFSDYRELIGRVDAVSIVTPTLHHWQIARDFLSAGVHVLVEKPMTATVEEAEDLIAIAAGNHRILQVGHLERFNSAFVAMQQRLRNPMFMEAQRLALFNERGLEVDVILDLMIHDIDIVLNIMQSQPTLIRASGVAVLTALPDIASVRMEFKNGAVANLAASRISTINMRKFRVFQETCYISADYAEKRAYAVYRENEEDERGYPEISMQELEVIEKDSLEEEIISFLDCIRTDKQPRVDGLNGRDALAVALEISRLIKEQMKTRCDNPGETPFTFS